MAEPAAEMSAEAASCELKSEPQRVYDIQFIPTEVSAKGAGVANLLDELRSFGELEVLNSPEAGASAVGFWQLRLICQVDQERFADQIDFVAENGAWRVVEEKPADREADSAFGFFDDAPGSPEDERGYGFFAPIEAPSHGQPEEETDGYGFFEPLAAHEITPAASPLPPDNDGDGYGFFGALLANNVFIQFGNDFARCHLAHSRTSMVKFWLV